MRQDRGGRRRNIREENRRAYLRENHGEYIYGNTVRKFELQEEWEEAPAKKQHPVVRKNREKARHMSAGYVMFLAAALCATAFILVNYIQLQSELTTLMKIVADKESDLNSLKLSNDEDYNRIMSGIDLEEIKRVAIGELGMTYAQEGQIVEYENEEGDYMRRVTGSGK
ncbi:MAG: cell division protein FtsL [Lachnospiraceae bacterium]|nr:cell division protein FtsL [Lachnospiraceae bacterium]